MGGPAVEIAVQDAAGARAALDAGADQARAVPGAGNRRSHSIAGHPRVGTRRGRPAPRERPRASARGWLRVLRGGGCGRRGRHPGVRGAGSRRGRGRCAHPRRSARSRRDAPLEGCRGHRDRRVPSCDRRERRSSSGVRFPDRGGSGSRPHVGGRRAQHRRHRAPFGVRRGIRRPYRSDGRRRCDRGRTSPPSSRRVWTQCTSPRVSAQARMLRPAPAAVRAGMTSRARSS